jgi:hypothetical protein
VQALRHIADGELRRRPQLTVELALDDIGVRINRSAGSSKVAETKKSRRRTAATDLL